MVDFALIQRLRALGVSDASFADGALESVTFFPPAVLGALAQDTVVAAESARIASALEPARARALRQQLGDEGDASRRTQLQDELDKVLAEDMVYGHS